MPRLLPPGLIICAEHPRPCYKVAGAWSLGLDNGRVARARMRAEAEEPRYVRLQHCRGGAGLELQTRVREDFTITEKAFTTSTFT